MDFEKELDETYLKLFKNFSNGIIHNVILWIISKEKIHGYGIMKKLEDFFAFDNVNCEIKINSSKIYPILKKMEENGVIKGKWALNNNKRVKYYTITSKGEILLENIKKNMSSAFVSPIWLEFVKDMTGLEIKYERN